MEIRVLTVKEAAEFAGVTRAWIYYLISQKRIKVATSNPYTVLLEGDSLYKVLKNGRPRKPVVEVERRPVGRPRKVREPVEKRPVGRPSKQDRQA